MSISVVDHQLLDNVVSVWNCIIWGTHGIDHILLEVAQRGSPDKKTSQLPAARTFILIISYTDLLIRQWTVCSLIALFYFILTIQCPFLNCPCQFFSYFVPLTPCHHVQFYTILFQGQWNSSIQTNSGHITTLFTLGPMLSVAAHILLSICKQYSTYTTVNMLTIQHIYYCLYVNNTAHILLSICKQYSTYTTVNM